MRTVLITGSSGFIGQHLSQVLKQNGFKVVSFSQKNSQDITKPNDFKTLPVVDTVFHLAAVSGYKDSHDNPYLAYKINVLGIVNVLEYCKRVNAKLIFPSTYVYDQPYKEYKKELDPAKPTTNYSFTKYLGERVCQFYSRVFQVDSLILRTSNVYGPGQTIKYLVPIVVDRMLSHKSLTLTKPGVERGFIHIDDLVEGYIKIAKAKTRPGEIYNIGPDRPTSLNQLVETIAKLVGKKSKIIYSGKERPYEVNINRVDVRKLKNKIDWKPKVSLKEGLRRYIKTLK